MPDKSFKIRILTASSGLVLASALAAPAMAQETETTTRRLDPVIVSASKSDENLQDIPLAVQTLSEQQLDELNVSNFDDYVRNLPGVNAAGRGPGQSSVFIRGIATDSSDQTSVEIGQPVPNVALYLDDQPVSSTGRNLDLYAADIARVEVLPGPQGTLYGASSQAGTIRLITNKPDYDEFGGVVKGSLATTKNGEMSNSEEFVLNVPIIKDKLAVRGVIYHSLEGGYIDNVPGTYTFDENAVSFPDGGVPSSADNADFVEDDFNDARYTGGRVSVGFKPSEDWEILLQYMQQSLDVDGVFDHSPNYLADLQPDGAAIGRTVGDLQVQRFGKDYLEDEFNQFSATVKGRLGALDVVYAGSFLDREVNNGFDYTTYNNIGPYAYYYICLPDYVTCGDPRTSVRGLVENERQTHELRAKYQGDVIGYTIGAFYDDSETRVNTEFFYAQAADYLPANAPISTATQFIPGPRDPGVTYFNDAIRSDEQTALFGEFSLQLVPDLLKASVGARYYEIETSLVGSSNYASFDTVDGDAGINFDEEFAGLLPLKQDGTVYKATLEYTPTDDLLLYGTYSEGFRPGGFNRIRATDGVPLTYQSDELSNYEFGWKASLLNDTLRINGAAYFITIDGLQVGITDPIVNASVTFTTNAVDAEVLGLETDFVYAATDNFTLFGAVSINDSEITKTPANVVNIAAEGSSLALAPELQINLRPRYEWSFNSSVDLYTQAVLAYTSSQYSSIVVANRYEQDAYTTLDASFGANINGNTNIELFVENLTDERAQLFINTLDTDLRVTTNRPQTIGIRAAFEF